MNAPALLVEAEPDAEPAVGTASQSSAPRRRSLRPRAAPWFFVAPALVLAVSLLAIPMLYTVWLSFRGNRVAGAGLGVKQEVFVGLDNYVRSLGNPDLLAGFGRMLLYGVISVPITMALALLFALLLDNASTRFGRFSRISIFVPYAVPGVIAALMWGFLYLPGVSPFVDVAQFLGLPAPSFLGPVSVFFSLANIAIWGSVGFNMVILYTSLRGLPSEIYDAARIDGCSEYQLATKIKMPLIVPGVIMTGLFSIIGALQVFSEPNTLLNLTTVIGSDFVPMMLVYRDAFITGDVFSASATSVVITVVTLLATLGLLRSLRGRAFGEDSK